MTESLHSPLALFDLHVEAFSGAATCIWFFRNQSLFSKSTGLVLASHAISHGSLVILALFNTDSKRASFLGVHSSVCQKYAAKKFHTSTHIYPSLGDSTLVAWDWCFCSFVLSKNCSQVAVDRYKNSSWCVLLILNTCSFVCDSCRISRKFSSFLCLHVKLLHHFLLPQSVLNPKEDIASSFVSSHVLPLGTPRWSI